MEPLHLLRRMAVLEQRVRTIEEKLAIEISPSARNTASPPPVIVPPPVTVGGVVTEDEVLDWVEVEPERPVPPKIPTTPHRPELIPLSVSAPVVDYAPPVIRPPAPRGELEQAIGLKWAGWIGAIVLVIGTGLGIKYAVDNGWLQVLPPAVRLGLMYLGGFALIGAGEWVYRRVNDIASAGVFAAGVATLFLVSYAGHGMYGLYARDTAFVLMGISTLVGAAVAIRGKLVSVATLSLIGGNIAPIVLHGDHARLTAFLSYLLMLQLVALVLAWWGSSRKWWTLRALSLGTTSLWMLWIIAQPQALGAPSPKIFLILFAGLFHAEVILSTAMRMRQPVEMSDSGTQPGVVFSTLVTAALSAGMYFLLRDQSNHLRGIWTLGFAAIACATAFALPRKKFPSLKGLSIGYGLQSAMLLIAAVPMLFTGAEIIFGWSILACGFAILGAILDLNLAQRAAVFVWGLGCLYLLKWGSTAIGNHTWLTILSTAIPAYLIVAAVLTVVGHIVAMLAGIGRQSGTDARATMHLLSAAAGVVWMIAALMALPVLGATLAFVLYAWLLFAGELLRPGNGWVHQSAIVLLVATVKWVVVDNLIDRVAPGWSAAQYTPVFNPVMGLGLLIAASLSAILWLRRAVFLPLVRGTEDRNQSRLVMLIGGFMLVVATIGFTFEIDRVIEQVRASRVLSWPPDQARHLAWTMLWSAAFCGLVALVHLLEPDESARRQRMRRLSFIPMALAIKFMIIDTLSFRVMGSPANVLVVANLQTLAAMFVLGVLVLTWFVSGDEGKTARGAIASFVVMLLFLTGTLEIDRWAGYQTFGYPWFVRQVAFSIFWSAFAVACVATGFRTRVAALRYCGLTLLAITLVKIVVVDLGHISTGYRVLSFMGLGLLMLGTSVLYGKLSPRLLALAESHDHSAT
jgi:uncharacterized membrane protein